MTMIEMPAVQTRLTSDEEQILLRVLREGATLATGPEGEAFEQEFAAFAGSDGAVAVNSCSSALELSAVLCGVGKGDEVIIPAHTFVSSAVPFARRGAKIVWADIDPDTAVLSASSVERLLTKRTKAIVVVHLYGLPADMDAILALAEPRGIKVVEDCAQAPGARYRGRRVGAIGHFGCFSFHTHKNINTLGEGGMLTTRAEEDAVSARKLRWMGNWPFEEERKRYWVPAMGNVAPPMADQWPYNFCLGEPNAAVGRSLIKRVDSINEQRRKQAARILAALTDCPQLQFQKVPDDREHAYHLLAARYDAPAGTTRDDLIQHLLDRYQLKTIVQYWPLHRTPLFQQFGFDRAEVPESDRWFDNMISFPWWSDMPDATIDDMAERIVAAIGDVSARAA